MTVDTACHEVERHAQKCRQCPMPIIDDEGNPGLFSEACAEGLRLLVNYMDALGEGDEVPRYARARLRVA